MFKSLKDNIMRGFIVAVTFAAVWLALTFGKHLVDTHFFTRPSTDLLDIYR